jgi:hypothetical protein
MTKSEFAPMLWLLVPRLTQVLREERGLTFAESIDIIYGSNLYRKLEDESTKLWHFSEYTLVDLLYAELEGRKVRYPEVAW